MEVFITFYLLFYYIKHEPEHKKLKFSRIFYPSTLFLFSMKLHQIHKELIRDWKPVPSVKANSFIIFLLCTELIEFLSCTLGSPKNTDPAFRLAKARHRLFPGLVRLGGASRGDPGRERNWPQSGVRQSGVGSVLIPSRSWKHHTGKKKTGLGSTRHCPTLPFLFSISSPKSGRTGPPGVCKGVHVKFCLSPDLRPQSPVIWKPVSSSSILPILIHYLMLSSLSSTNFCPLFSRPPFPVTLTTLVPVKFVSFKEKTPQYLQAFYPLPQRSQKTPIPGRASFLS